MGVAIFSRFGWWRFEVSLVSSAIVVSRLAVWLRETLYSSTNFERVDNPESQEFAMDEYHIRQDGAECTQRAKNVREAESGN